MRARMLEADRQRHLRIVRALDARCRRRRGTANGGRRRRRRAAHSTRSPLFERDRDGIVAGLDVEHFVVDQAQIGKRCGALLERRDQMAVLDIVAEGIEPDFVRRRISPPARATAARYRRRCA